MSKSIYIASIALSVATAAPLFAAPITLNGTTYAQNFDSIGTALPAGWDVRTGSTASSLGTIATLNATAQTGWTDSAGSFKNFPSPDGGSDRTLGVRQTGSFGDPGASFNFNIANTTGLTFSGLSVKAQVVGNQPRSTTYSLQFGIGATPTTWTTLTTIVTDADKNQTLTASAANLLALNNQSSQVWFRVAALGTSSGSGNRDSFGIDDFTLDYSAAATNDTVLSLSPSTVQFGRVKQNASGVTRALTISEAAGGTSTTANFTTSTSGGSGPSFSGLGSGSIAANGGSASQTLTLNTGTIGTISRSVTLANGSNTADTTGTKSVTVTGNVVADRTVNAELATFGKVLRGAEVTGDTLLSTPVGQADSSYTRVALSGGSQGAQNGIGLAAGTANVFGTGASQVQRTLVGQFTSGSGTQTGSFDIDVADEFEEAGTVNVGYAATVYDLGTPSFEGLLEVSTFSSTSLELEAGGVQQVIVPIYNLAGIDAAYTVGLEFDGSTIDPSAPLTVSGFDGVLAAGTAGNVTFNIDTSLLSVGDTFSYQVTLVLNNEDQGVQGVDLLTGRSLSYTLAGTVVPEPATLGLLGLGGLLMGRRRRM